MKFYLAIILTLLFNTKSYTQDITIYELRELLSDSDNSIAEGRWDDAYEIVNKALNAIEKRESNADKEIIDEIKNKLNYRFHVSWDIKGKLSAYKNLEKLGLVKRKLTMASDGVNKSLVISGRNYRENDSVDLCKIVKITDSQIYVEVYISRRLELLSIPVK
jgi:hypothetical protein